MKGSVRAKQEIASVNQTFESVLQKFAEFSHLFLKTDASDGVLLPAKVMFLCENQQPFIAAEVIDQRPPL